MLIETQRIAQKLGRIQSPPSGTKEELEGIEPSSKQGNTEFSTCLSQPKFSSEDPTWATGQRLIP